MEDLKAIFPDLEENILLHFLELHQGNVERAVGDILENASCDKSENNLYRESIQAQGETEDEEYAKRLYQQIADEDFARKLQQEVNQQDALHSANHIGLDPADFLSEIDSKNSPADSARPGSTSSFKTTSEPPLIEKIAAGASVISGNARRKIKEMYDKAFQPKADEVQQWPDYKNLPENDTDALIDYEEIPGKQTVDLPKSSTLS